MGFEGCELLTDPNRTVDFEHFMDQAKTMLETEFPDEDLRPNDLVIALNRAAGIAIRSAEGQVHRPKGLSWNAFKMLFILWIRGDMEQHRVSQLGGMSRATTSAVVKVLVRLNYLIQTQSEADKRTNVLALTDAGSDIAQEIFLEQNELLRSWSDRLTHTEQDMLKMLLGKLMRGRD